LKAGFFARGESYLMLNAYYLLINDKYMLNYDKRGDILHITPAYLRRDEFYVE